MSRWAWLEKHVNWDGAAFWRWWSAELAFLCPRPLRRWWQRRQSRLVIAVAAQHITLYRLDRDVAQVLGQYNRDEFEWADVERLFAQQPDLAELERTLLLSETSVLQRVLSLPAAARDNLAQVVGYELDRYTPFKAGTLYHDVQLIHSDDTDRLQVRFAAVLRTELDTWLERLNRCQLSPSRVDVAQSLPAQTAIGAGFNLLPSAYQQVGGQGVRIATYTAAGVLCVLFGAIGALPAWLDEQFLDELRQQQRRLNQASQAVESLREEVDALQRGALFVLDKKLNRPPVTAVLQDITHRMPDDAWVNNLQIRDKRLEMQGQANTASALIAALEASPYLNNTTFLSPVTPDRVSGQERFRIGADIVAPESSEDYGRETNAVTTDTSAEPSNETAVTPEVEAENNEPAANAKSSPKEAEPALAPALPGSSAPDSSHFPAGFPQAPNEEIQDDGTVIEGEGDSPEYIDGGEPVPEGDFSGPDASMVPPP